MTFYAILNVPDDADQERIRSSYKALARRYHPDTGFGSSAEKFRLVVEAYETLKDPQRRALYDRSLRRAQHAIRIPEESVTVRPEPFRHPPAWAPVRSPLYDLAFDRRPSFDEMFDELIWSLRRPFFFRLPW